MSNEVTVAFYKERVVGVANKKMPRIMTAIATEYANEVKTLMRDSPATGRVYRRGNVEHRASAPGEPPAPDTGQLVQSVRWRVRKLASGGWVAEVGSALKKALYLEFGAAQGVRGKSGRLESVRWVLFPRPAWGPALRTIRTRIPGIIRRFSR